MRGYIDLHSHWVAGIDDGAKTFAESLALLQGLKQAGFDTVVATPHMRPGMFDNTKADLEKAYARTLEALVGAADLPEVSLSSEHFFDDVVFQRLIHDDGLPYPGGRAALIEFPNQSFPIRVTHRLFDMQRRQLRPVLAHPERYEPVWQNIEVLDPLIDGGTVLLLDVAALAGKYGRKPRAAAQKLLEANYYYAACSDAHGARDIADVSAGIALLHKLIGKEEAEFLLIDGPRAILDGRVET